MGKKKSVARPVGRTAGTAGTAGRTQRPRSMWDAFRLDRSDMMIVLFFILLCLYRIATNYLYPEEIEE